MIHTVVTTTLDLPGFTAIESLSRSSKTQVFRAVQEESQRPVVVKVLGHNHPSFGELVHFRNQYAIARHLDHPAIVTPLGLERYGNGYALIMPDDGLIALPRYWNHRDETVDSVLAIALQLTDALHYLIGQRVIHKDIKPANILIHPETKRVQLIDFSISSLLPQEQQELTNPLGLEGTLAYLAPEQTGRMNRGIDYRSDFYTLGVTLYELLTGELPFPTDDPMALVHHHMTTQPPVAHALNSEVPPILSEIIVKLMAKNAEDRYQSALGLKYDLERCRTEWLETGPRIWFQLAERDVSDRFLIPERLYGRDDDVMTLLSAFNRVSAGCSELMLVAGFSGIGKTAVVNEVHKPITRQRGYFIKGKFDQFNRNIPFSAFVQAFRSLMGQLLSESDSELAHWKSNILEAVGENGQVLIDVLPELAHIIGPQSAVPELSGSAAQNRFNLLFQNFIAVFTTPEHPLVMFLDDLQWADSASLGLLNLLMSESETGYLLVLGAYRDNEVFPAHPLMLTLGDIQKHQAQIQTITLNALAPEHIHGLVADTLLCSPEVAAPLADLVYQKTQGNPFFATQFLQGLYEDNCITFNSTAGHWQCDLTQVRQLALTDDVVEFMVRRLQKLPDVTQEILKLAACIGNQFDLTTLAMVCDRAASEVAADLWDVLQEGLVIPETKTYKFFQASDALPEQTSEVSVHYRFLHDRVQQAAYALIPDEQKQSTHYSIGRLLLRQIPLEAREERIFELVNQLNYGQDLMTQPTEREELAQLNLTACRKARSATAYGAGREYATTGLSLLPDTAWQDQYQMCLAFHDLAVELTFLCKDFEAMEQFMQTILTESRTLLDQVLTYRIKVQAAASQNKLLDAVTIARQFLEKLGMTFPESPTEADVGQALAEVRQLIGDRPIESLIDLPPMSDAQQIAIVQIANGIMPAVYLSCPSLFPLLVCATIKLSLEYGNAPASAYSYSCYGLIACKLMQDVEIGVQFGQLALQVVSTLNAKAIQPDVATAVGSCILHRKDHIHTMLPVLREGYEIALEIGNTEFAGYNAHVYCLDAFWCNQLLPTLLQETSTYCHALVQFNQLTSANYCRLYWQSTLNLMGDSDHPTVLSGDALEEAEWLPQMLEANDLYGLYFFYLSKLMLCYLFGEIEAAQHHALQIKPYFEVGTGSVGEPAFYFYQSLTALAALEHAFEEVATELLQTIDRNQTQMQQHWASHAPMNYQHKVDLVEAERCRFKKDKIKAIELYDRAIAGAKANEFIQEEALANERAATFYLDWGKPKIAAVYMQDAYYCYAHWGAKAKIEDLERRYPQLLQPILQRASQQFNLIETFLSNPTASISRTPSTSTDVSASVAISTSTSRSYASSTTGITALDFAAVLKASQALSEILQLDELLQQLTQIILQNADSDRCALILPSRQDKWQVRAIATPGDTQLYTDPLEQHPNLPEKLIQYVKNTKDIVVIDDLETDLSVIDTYLQRYRPKSILCLPILNQSRCIGVISVENHFTKGVFTKERLLILNFLCTQAAISIENARLFAETLTAAESLRKSQAKLNATANSLPGLVYQFRIDAEGNASFPYLSDRATELLEFERHILETRVDAVIQCINPEDIKAYELAITQSRKHLTPFVWIGRFTFPSGRIKWIEARSTPTRQEDGACLWDGVMLDVSDRQAAEMALAESEAYHRNLFEQSSIGLLLCRMNGEFVYANQAFADILGREKEELPDLTYWEITPEKYADDEQIQLQSLNENSCYGPYEKEYIHKDGNLIPVRLSGVIVERNDEQFIWSSIENISDRKRAEKAILQKSQALEQTLATLEKTQIHLVQSEKMSALGSLVAGVAHEINNPVGCIIGNVSAAQDYINDLLGLIDLYAQECPEPGETIEDELDAIDLNFVRDDLPKLIQAMQDGGDRIRSISRSLRTFSRADTETKQAFDLHEGLDSTVLILRHRLKANEQRSAIDVIKDYGELPEIACFPGQLNQVFMNILANAIDALDEASQHRGFDTLKANPHCITIRTRLESQQVLITISDNGPGMPEAVKDRIFDRLFTTKAIGKGTGLGLAIAHQIVVDTHGGELNVQSHIDQGTEFCIGLPL